MCARVYVYVCMYVCMHMYVCVVYKRGCTAFSLGLQISVVEAPTSGQRQNNIRLNLRNIFEKIYSQNFISILMKSEFSPGFLESTSS